MSHHSLKGPSLLSRLHRKNQVKNEEVVKQGYVKCASERLTEPPRRDTRFIVTALEGEETAEESRACTHLRAGAAGVRVLHTAVGEKSGGGMRTDGATTTTQEGQAREQEMPSHLINVY